MKIKKNFIFVFLFFIISTFTFSQSYIINSVDYEITGKTKKEYLETKLNIQVNQEFKTENDLNADFEIGDEQGNVLIQAKDGHIKTKNFDSQNSGSSGTIKK